MIDSTLPIRLIVLAAYPVVCAGLRRLLESDAALQIIGESAYPREAAELARRERPDVALVDPDATQVSLAAVSVVAEACNSPILVFTASADPALAIRAIELGAAGVLSKVHSADLLIRAIRKIHAGELWIDRANTAAILSRAVRRDRDPELMKIESLTKREREIVLKIGEGLKNVSIAEQLFISEATVRNHLTSILSKLGLSDRFELAVYAYRHALVERPDINNQPRPTPASAERRVLNTTEHRAVQIRHPVITPVRHRAADAVYRRRSQPLDDPAE